MVEHEITSFFDRITIVISRIAMYITGILVAIMFYEVVVRYLFEKPTLWANELSMWLAGIIYLFAGLYVMQQRGHIRIFILYDAVSRPMQRLFDLISTLLIVAFAGAVIWGSFGDAWQKLVTWEREGTAWNPPIPATMKPLLLVVIVLIALQAVSNLIADWRKDKVVH
ncbi:MAG: TRAP transporter small permease subunit, partial [Alphaproteobacteria bacterium]